MSELVEISKLMLWPLAACVCIGLLHAYAGLHVLRRGVIFVDLALAQMAALGAVIGASLGGPEPHSHEAPASMPAPKPAGNTEADPADQELQALLRTMSGSTRQISAEHEEETPAGLSDAWPMMFALGGAILLAFGRLPGERVPHEAIIGILYVVAAATTVLILSKSPHGHEQMEQMLTGKLLFVGRGEVLATAGIYSGLGLLHWLFRRPFLAISESLEEAQRRGLRVRLWDCVFYAMFAVMVTRSVAMGGVLIVFSFLIIPGACAALLVGGFARRVLLAWIVALAVSVIGLTLSAAADLPTGSTLVATFGGALIVSLALSAALPRPKPPVAAGV